ncbi:signal peptidase I [Knoellia sp. CPCC 206435]|uniref:signal peptidase I n=1 Tax=Knoellia terrae TaxID=3404797 RepID=UPI003B437183
MVTHIAGRGVMPGGPGPGSVATRRSWSRWAYVAASTVGLCLVVRVAVLEPRQVASESMEPTLHPGSVVLIDKLGPRLRGVQREDVVVFRNPQDGRAAVKRVVALAGQQVAIRDAELFVDGSRVVEPQVDRSRIDGTWFGPVVVPEGSVFVLGDARSGSVDSRVFGPVPLGAVVGRVALAW